MTDLKAYYGICTTCNHAHSCTNATNEDRPTWQCEEFDTVTIVKSLNKIEDIDGKKAYRHISAKRNEYLGLCNNCEHQSYCTLAKSEGGIWHCEEYA